MQQITDFSISSWRLRRVKSTELLVSYYNYHRVYMYILGAIVRRRGFSLIELMVVIAIVAVLAVVAVPAYKAYSIRAKLSATVPYAESVIRKAQEYYYEHGVAPLSQNTLGLQRGTGSPYDFYFSGDPEALEFGSNEVNGQFVGEVSYSFSVPGFSMDSDGWSGSYLIFFHTEDGVLLKKCMYQACGDDECNTSYLGSTLVAGCENMNKTADWDGENYSEYRDSIGYPIGM